MNRLSVARLVNAICSVGLLWLLSFFFFSCADSDEEEEDRSEDRSGDAREPGDTEEPGDEEISPNPTRAGGIFGVSVDAVPVSVAGRGVSADLPYADFHVRNLVEQPIRLLWSMEEVPAHWTFHFCDPVVCYAPGVTEGEFSLEGPWDGEDAETNRCKFTLRPAELGGEFFEVARASFVIRIKDPDADFHKDISIDVEVIPSDAPPSTDG